MPWLFTFSLSSVLTRCSKVARSICSRRTSMKKSTKSAASGPKTTASEPSEASVKPAAVPLPTPPDFSRHAFWPYFKPRKEPLPVPADILAIFDHGNTAIPSYGEEEDRVGATKAVLRRRYEALRFVGDEQGAMEAREFYVNTSMTLDPTELSEFGRACAMGEAEVVGELIEAVKNTEGISEQERKEFFRNSNEWTFRFSYLQLAVAGCQRIKSDKDEAVVWERYTRVFKLLLSAGVDVNYRELAGYSAFYQSLEHIPKLDVARWLLLNGADPNLPNIFGSMPLIECLATFAEKEIEFLIEIGASLDFSPDNETVTPMKLLRTAKARFPDAFAMAEERRQKQLALAAVTSACNWCASTIPQKDSGWTSNKVCTRCRECWYCCPSCQKFDWSSHKPECSAAPKPDPGKNIVTLTLEDVAVTDNTEAEKAMSEMDGPIQATDFTTELPTKPPSSGRFVVKITNPGIKADADDFPGMDKDSVAAFEGINVLSIFDETRKYMARVPRRGNEEAYDRIVKVTEEKGTMELKIYAEAFVPKKDGGAWDMRKLSVDLGKVSKPATW